MRFLMLAVIAAVVLPALETPAEAGWKQSSLGNFVQYSSIAVDATSVSADGKAIGIISDRDVSRLAPSVLSSLGPDEYNKVFEGTPIALAMTKELVTIHPDAPVQQAVQLMTDKKISSVLVAEADGKLVGIITTTDLLSLLERLLVAVDQK